MASAKRFEVTRQRYTPRYKDSRPISRRNYRAASVWCVPNRQQRALDATQELGGNATNADMTDISVPRPHGSRVTTPGSSQTLFKGPNHMEFRPKCLGETSQGRQRLPQTWSIKQINKGGKNNHQIKQNKMSGLGFVPS